MIRHVSVRLPAAPDRSYEVLIHPGLIRDLAALVAPHHRGGGVFIVTDSNVAHLYGRETQLQLIAAGFETFMLDVPSGERSKSIDVYSALMGALLTHGVRRNSLIIALGGGVVGDLAGFAAASILRGVPYIQVPTSLLAQVDSSIGGKVGIDHAVGKNLIGAFHQPSLVVIDPGVLRTLPNAEFRNGLAEVVKIAAALDKHLFARIERTAGKITRANARLLSGIISASVGLKAAVVRRDEREAGLRKSLNLGHTIGHAVEAASGFRLRHGEAVSIGLVIEGRLAVASGILLLRHHLRILRLLDRLGLPTSIPGGINRRKILTGLASDKKNRDATPLFVLPRKIGACAIDVVLPPELIQSTIT